MARRALFVTLLAGCNSILGNDRPLGVDARYFDASTDAPFGCPEAGAPPPVFNIELHGMFVQPCLDFSVRGDRATAACNDPDGNKQVYEGPLGGPLQLVPTFSEGPLLGAYDQPRLSSDGQILYARHTDFQTSLEVRFALRQPDNSWLFSGIAPIFTTTSDSISTIAPSPEGDHILVREAGANVMQEWVGRGADWHLVRSETGAELGLPLGPAKLSLDGLRVVQAGFGVSNQVLVYYTDRPSIDAPFRAAEPFPTAPQDPNGALMTEDCARLYVAGIGEVFYAQQR